MARVVLRTSDENDAPAVLDVVLSWRNLWALVSKVLTPGSACTLLCGDVPESFAHALIRVEPDDLHYCSREAPPGPMHPLAEALIPRIQQMVDELREAFTAAGTAGIADSPLAGPMLWPEARLAPETEPMRADRFADLFGSGRGDAGDVDEHEETAESLLPVERARKLLAIARNDPDWNWPHDYDRAPVVAAEFGLELAHGNWQEAYQSRHSEPGGNVLTALYCNEQFIGFMWDVPDDGRGGLLLFDDGGAKL